MINALSIVIETIKNSHYLMALSLFLIEKFDIHFPMVIR